MSRPPSEFVHWPDGYAPASARVYAHNELVIPTSPDRIWEWLVRARQWPHWYPNSWSVKILKRGKELLTTQCYVKGDAANDRDGIYRSLKGKARDAVTIDFAPVQDSKIGELAAKFDIVLGMTPEA